MQHKTMAELKANIKRLDAEIDVANAKRGYCVLDFPKVSDTFAVEVFDRYYMAARDFLHQYAEILIKHNAFPKLEDTSKLQQWYDCFRVAGMCGIEDLHFELVLYEWTLKTAIQGKGGCQLPIQVASHISKMLKTKSRKGDFTYDYELQQRDYDGDFDVYLAQKTEEIEQWRALH